MAQVDDGTLGRETPVNPYSLLEAVNAASDSVNTGWLIFLGLMAYVLIAVAGVTHKDILLETPVALPIMQVSVQLRQFFTFVPVVLVLFHLGIVAQLVLLARKALAFDEAVQLIEPTPQRTHPLRLELHNFFFVQAIAGPERSRVMSGFLHGMSWLTTLIIPVLLLLYIQVAFLPYHDVTITWVHRFALVFDLVLLLLIGTFLLRTESSFFQALVRNAKAHPFNVAFTSLMLLAVGFISFFVATIPGENLDRVAQTVFGAPKPVPSRDRHAAVGGGFQWPWLTSASDGALFGMFRRNLVVTDTDLVQDRDVQPDEATLSLRGRDLRFSRLDRSDLHQADLTGADLTGASLVGTDLRRAGLNCGDLNAFLLSNERASARCVRASSANFSRARLDGARLTGADLSNARFEDAGLEAANLAHAQLTGTDFSSAYIARADLTGGVPAQGANFLLASLEGADLTGAQLEGADFTTANLRMALLNFSRLDGATLQNANLEGASMTRAFLRGADMTGARIGAADLRGVNVWMTAPPSTAGRILPDAREMVLKAPDPKEATAMVRLVEILKTPQIGALRAAERISLVIAQEPSRQWPQSPAAQSWQAITGQADGGSPQQRRILTDYLAGVLCRAGNDNGAAATGVVRRAQSSQFTGDPNIIYGMSKRDDCPGAKAVPADLINGLAAVAGTRVTSETTAPVIDQRQPALQPPAAVSIEQAQPAAEDIPTEPGSSSQPADQP